MPPKPHVLADTKVVADRATNTIVLTRTFNAPCEQVFEAWTQPDHVACWWDPSGARLSVCEIDLKPDGAFRFVNRDQPDVPPFSGVYREIVPPQKLVFEAMGAIGRVTLEDTGGETLLTVSITCGSAAHFDQFLQMGVDAGTSQTLDNLVDYVGSMKE
jgi:uncharacterized protein YndB with AHSA1/START domain